MTLCPFPVLSVSCVPVQLSPSYQARKPDVTGGAVDGIVSTEVFDLPSISPVLDLVILNINPAKPVVELFTVMRIIFDPFTSAMFVYVLTAVYPPAAPENSVFPFRRISTTESSHIYDSVAVVFPVTSTWTSNGTWPAGVAKSLLAFG